MTLTAMNYLLNIQIQFHRFITGKCSACVYSQSFIYPIQLLLDHPRPTKSSGLLRNCFSKIQYESYSI